MKRIAKWLKKYFIPHHGNEFKPHFLRHESMMFFLFLVLAIEIGFLVQVFVIFDKTNFLASVLPGVLTNLTNAEREENGAPPLTENELLAQAAEMKAQDMASNGYFAHTSPDGKTPWYWLQQVGYSYSYAGENLAVNFFDSEDVAQAWMNSPTHRANIVKDKYTEIGIGVARGEYQGRETVFVAQFFGTPINITPITLPEPEEVKTTPKTSPAPVKTPEVKETKPAPLPKPKPAEPAPVQTPPAPEPEPVITTPTEVVLNPAITPSATQILGEETVGVSKIQANTKSFIQRVLSSPRQYMNYAYGGILLIVILSMSLVVFMRSEVTHPALVARGAALVAVVLLIIFFDTRVLTVDRTKVPTDGLSASVIAY